MCITPCLGAKLDCEHLYILYVGLGAMYLYRYNKVLLLSFFIIVASMWFMLLPCFYFFLFVISASCVGTVIIRLQQNTIQSGQRESHLSEAKFVLPGGLGSDGILCERYSLCKFPSQQIPSLSFPTPYLSSHTQCYFLWEPLPPLHNNE